MSALEAAIEKAKQFVGATAPNPPVGAAAIDHQGHILSVQAHEQAGTAHAEAKVIADLRERGILAQADTLFITLEPCNHQGRTPPCTDAILASGIRQVIYGVPDPNPRVAGQGAARLRAEGLNISQCSDPALSKACQDLIRPFAHWATTGRPWVVIKTALTSQGSMIPPLGQKTFTSNQSLKLAHELRKRADAILTGSGTVIADSPEFTVRHVLDHAIVSNHLKKRRLVVLDHRGRTPPEWIAREQALGFEVILCQSRLEDCLNDLGKMGVLEVLVEAGPKLSTNFLNTRLWNQHVVITQGNPDQVQTIERD